MWVNDEISAIRLWLSLRLTLSTWINSLCNWAESISLLNYLKWARLRIIKCRSIHHKRHHHMYTHIHTSLYKWCRWQILWLRLLWWLIFQHFMILNMTHIGLHWVTEYTQCLISSHNKQYLWQSSFDIHHCQAQFKADVKNWHDIYNNNLDPHQADQRFWWKSQALL